MSAAKNAAGVFESGDMGAVGAVFRGAEITQISPGPCTVTRRFVSMNGILCFRSHFSQRLLFDAQTSDDYYMFLVPTALSSEIEYFGQRLGRSRIGYSAPGTAVDGLTPLDSNHLTLFVPKTALDMPGATPLHDRVSEDHVFECDTAVVQRFVDHAYSLVERCIDDPSMVEDSAGRRVLESRLMGGLLTCADRASEHDRARSSRSRRAALGRALHAAERAEWKIGTAQLAAAAGVSQRTLQLAFLDRFGVSPTSFLRVRRLNGARRDLLGATPDETTVQAIATEWGFTELGRFAGVYRGFFGELPSKTLRDGAPHPVPGVLALA